MVILTVQCKKNFGFDGEGPKVVTMPKGTIFILGFIDILWITSAVAVFVDWPKDSQGVELRKRYDIVEGIGQGISNGPLIGCIVMDFVFA
jgi:hypothetical protein